MNRGERRKQLTCVSSFDSLQGNQDALSYSLCVRQVWRVLERSGWGRKGASGGDVMRLGSFRTERRRRSLLKHQIMSIVEIRKPSVREMIRMRSLEENHRGESSSSWKVLLITGAKEQLSTFAFFQKTRIFCWASHSLWMQIECVLLRIAPSFFSSKIQNRTWTFL